MLTHSLLAPPFPSPSILPPTSPSHPFTSSHRSSPPYSYPLIHMLFVAGCRRGTYTSRGRHRSHSCCFVHQLGNNSQSPFLFPLPGLFHPHPLPILLLSPPRHIRVAGCRLQRGRTHSQEEAPCCPVQQSGNKSQPPTPTPSLHPLPETPALPSPPPTRCWLQAAAKAHAQPGGGTVRVAAVLFNSQEVLPNMIHQLVQLVLALPHG